jgi:pyruvate-formate lyase-activating enzyme
MKLRVLLVNPWIYDFTAYNLWASPLGLLKVAEHLSCFETDLRFIDCLDSFSPGQYGAGRFRAERVEKPRAVERVPLHFRRYGISPGEFATRLREALPVDIVCVTSLMTYWYPGVQKAIEIVRSHAGAVPVILGGIYATLAHDHAVRHTGADLVYRGWPRDGLGAALGTFGFRLRKKTGGRPYYRLGLGETRHFAPLLTSRGCPYRCPYCASSLLSSSVEFFETGQTLREIEDLAMEGVRDFAFYDDALLADADRRLKPLLRAIVDKGLGLRFHTPNGLHARFLDEEVAGLMREGGFRTIRLSLETVDAARQASSGGKVTNREIETAVRNLMHRGFTKKEIGVYLMYGLPGQDLEEVREGIRFLGRLGVRIHLTEFSPVRGTDYWYSLASQGTISDDGDPLVTNNSAYTFLFGGYDRQEIERLKLTVKEHNAA